MRFAYIDSNGNEVPIPSVDALALRIELGAITDETQLYDAQADLWAPANSHEIYHTLSRDTADDAGFVPAPVAPPSPSTPAAAPEEPVVETVDLEPEPESPAPESEAASDAPLELADPIGSDAGPTLADDPPVESEAPEVTEVLDETESSEDLGLDTLDLAPVDFAPPESADEPLDLSAPVPESSDASEVEEVASPSFDFGEMDGGLEMEAPFGGPDEVDEGPMDFSDSIPDADAAPTPDFSGGMELETAMEFDSGAGGLGGGGALELESPMSEFSPDAPPGWMEEGRDAEDADVMDLSSVGARPEEVAADVTGPTEQRVPKDRPSKPKFKRQRNLAGPIVGVMLLLVVGIGGYAAWPAISARFAGEVEDAGTAIPEIPVALEGQMRAIANVALAAAYEDVRSSWASPGPVADPGEDWLSGRYLANASEYSEAEAFWEGVSDLMAEADGVDLAAFDAAYKAELQSQSVSEADGVLMLARADSGFVAASAERAGAHQRMEDLAAAALRLHGFLIANEDDIAYVPAAAATTDPILEADPSTPELRASMEALIDDVTSTLSELDYRDQVTAAGLWQTLVANVQESGIR